MPANPYPVSYVAEHSAEQGAEQGAGAVGNAVGNLQGLTPKQIQRLLKAKGYNVVVDGKMGPNTKTAMDAYVHGKPPAQYNTWWAKQIGHGAGNVGNQVGGGHGGGVGANTAIHAAANATATSAAKGGGKQKPSALNALAQISASIGVPIPTSVADDLVSGDTAAIKVIQDAINKQPGQATQNEHDIQHWYGQVLDALTTAGTRDAEIGKAGRNSVSDATAKIIASLGGSANEGSANVAAAGAADAGTLAALSTTQDQYNSDMAPLLHSEAAGASTRQRALDTATASDLRNQMIQAVGQKGTDRAKALMDITSHNDTLAQQRFQNQLALQQEKDAQKAMGLKSAALNIPKSISPTQLTHVASIAYNTFTDPNTHQVSIKGKSVQEIVKGVNNAYLAAGLDLGNPQVAESALGVLRQLGIQPDPGWYGLGH